MSKWLGDWRKGLSNSLSKRGFKNLCDFLANSPARTYLELAEEIDVPAAHIYILQVEEGIAQRRLREVAMDSLIRTLRGNVTNGWNRGIHFNRNRASAFGHWKSILLLAERFGNITDEPQRTWDCLKSLSPPDGWLPENIDDDYIQRAFNMGWPES